MAIKLILLVLTLFSATKGQDRAHRFEYKHSFKGPHLVQKDGSVPFWKHEGNAIPSDDFVRVVPSLKSQRGLIWNKIPVEFDAWEVEMTIKVTGRGRVGADGLALWYTMNSQPQSGRVFGSGDKWMGLGVIFDSFDNDGMSNNPYISAVVNDGTKEFDHHTDGTQNLLGGCVRDYRNKPYPVRVKVRYEERVLTLSIMSGLTNQYTDRDFEPCFRVENVELQRGGHFSISAATGGLADDHDVISFLTHSLRRPDEMKQGAKVEEEQKQIYADEYNKYNEQLDQAKDEYRKENPQDAPQHEDFMDAETRELRMIFEGQDHINKAINTIHKRITELSQNLPTGGAAAGGAPAGIDANTRSTLDSLVRQGQDLSRLLQELQNAVNRLPTQQGSGGINQNQYTNDMEGLKSEVKRLSAGVTAMAQQGTGQQGDCPKPDCLSTMFFMVFVVAQIVVLVLYNLFLSRKEAQAKKFY